MQTTTASHRSIRPVLTLVRSSDPRPTFGFSQTILNSLPRPQARVLLALVSRLDTEMITADLRRVSCEVITSSNIFEARSRLFDEYGLLDLVVLDQSYPDGRGVDLLDRIRRSGGQLDLPVIFAPPIPQLAQRTTPSDWVSAPLGRLRPLPTLRPTTMSGVRLAA